MLLQTPAASGTRGPEGTDGCGPGPPAGSAPPEATAGWPAASCSGRTRLTCASDKQPDSARAERTAPHTLLCNLLFGFRSVLVHPSRRSPEPWLLPSRVCIFPSRRHRRVFSLALVSKHSACFCVWEAQSVVINIHGHMSLQEEDPAAAGWGVRRTEQTELLRCAPAPRPSRSPSAAGTPLPSLDTPAPRPHYGPFASE